MSFSGMVAYKKVCGRGHEESESLALSESESAALVIALPRHVPGHVPK